MNYSTCAQNVFTKEINCLKSIQKSLNDEFDDFVFDLDNCRGNLIWMGIGKSGYICKKIVATLQSLGIKALFLHPSEALHGDLGIVSSEDILIIVSNSGETKELLDTLLPVRNLGAKIFCIVGKPNTTIAKASDKSLIIPVSEEVFLDMVPTSSTTAAMVVGDAIAVSIASRRHFTKEDFGKYHPNGQLGKRLTLHVKDIMLTGSDNSLVLEGSNIEQVIFEMCKKTVGAVAVTNKTGKLKGIFTDGDLRRFTNTSNFNPKIAIIDDYMIKEPITLQGDQLLYDAIISTISNHSVSVYPVIDTGKNLIGMLRIIDVIKTGLL